MWGSDLVSTLGPKLYVPPARASPQLISDVPSLNPILVPES